MATYKQPCAQCGELLDRSSRACPKCGSGAPFGFQCPACFAPIARGDAVCSGCGIPLTVTCFLCGQLTFAGADKCDACGRSIMLRCDNPRCGQPVFFQNTKCLVCGKPLKKAKKQMANLKKGAV